MDAFYSHPTTRREVTGRLKKRGGQMEERRKSERHITDLKAQYCLEEEEDWKKCTIMDLGQEGMGIRFQNSGKVCVGSTIYLKYFLHENAKPIDAKGTVRWIKEENDVLICGINFVLLKRKGQ